MTSRRSSGSNCVDSAVEPTISQNITVNWRRSASGWDWRRRGSRCRRRRGVGPAGASAPSAAMAERSLRRWPTRSRRGRSGPRPSGRQDVSVDIVVAERRLVLLQDRADEANSRHRSPSQVPIIGGDPASADCAAAAISWEAASWSAGVTRAPPECRVPRNRIPRCPAIARPMGRLPFALSPEGPETSLCKRWQSHPVPNSFREDF